VFCARNGTEPDPDDDAAYDLVVAVASGTVDDVTSIADALATFVH
jgi:death on curing protein